MVEAVPVTPVILILLPTDNPWARDVVIVTIPAVVTFGTPTMVETGRDLSTT